MSDNQAWLTIAIGPDGSDSAVRFAVDHAHRSGAALRLVHVLHLSTSGPFPPPYAPAAAAARGVLSRAAATAADQDPQVAVDTELVETGTLVSQLVSRSASSQAVILQHRHLPRLSRLVTGSAVNGVASRATVPVIAVPEDWRPATTVPPVITVAIQDAEEARRLLRSARALADPRGATLVVLHAWWMGHMFDMEQEDEHIRAWKDQTRGWLQEAIDAAGVTDLVAGVRIEHRPKVEAIVNASTESDLLVVGRRHHLLTLGTHLGPVARGVIDHARCPVALAPETH